MIIELDCIKCAACCFFPESIGKEYNNGKVKVFVKEDGWCNHKTDEGCDIYEDRPEQCKDFPKGSDVCLNLRKLLKIK